MTTYVMLANWTDQGALKVKDSPRRLDAAKKALKDMSGEFKSFVRTRTLKAFPEAAYREIISSLG
jgi:uncharacterized protein with GYD domain